MLDAILKRFGYVKPTRAFQAAKINRLTSGFSTQSQPIDVDIRNGLRIIRARSREQAQNNDHVKRFLGLVKTNVIGHTGIILQSKVKNLRNDNADDVAVQAIESAWTEWGKIGSCDITGKLSWKQLQRVFVETLARDGEAIARFRYQGYNKERFQLELIDPEALDVDLNRDLGNGNKIKMGVELNTDNRPVAYYFKTNIETEYNFGKKNYARIPASEVIHAFLPEWVWQSRGIPWATTAMLRLGMLSGYEEAALVAARAGAAKMGFFYSEGSGVYTGEGEDADGSIIMDAEPGTFEQLPDGVKFQPYDPQNPNTDYADFIKATLRSIASGLGVSYNALANDLEGVNYSSLRQGAIDDRAVWMMIQDFVIEILCEPVFNAWLVKALDAGIPTRFGGTLRKQDIDRYKAASWQARRWQWVDPLKEISAHEKAISLGIKSRSDVIREQGRDPEDVWSEIAYENQRMIDLGVESAVSESGGVYEDQD